jgi:hypothetical protein
MSEATNGHIQQRLQNEQKYEGRLNESESVFALSLIFIV